MANIQDIPTDILYLIFQKLSSKYISSIQKLNKYFNNMCDTNLIWEFRFKLDFSNKINNNGPWKIIYKTCISDFNQFSNMADKIDWIINNGYLNFFTKLVNKILKNKNFLKILNIHINIGDWLIPAVLSNKLDFVKCVYKIPESKFDLSNYNRQQIFYRACEKGYFDLVEFLFEQDHQINFEYINFFPLYVATLKGNYKIVEFLIKNGGLELINKKGGDGSTPLYVACQNNYPDLVDLLLKNGANPEYTYEGVPPIFIASQNGYTKIVELLCNYNANTNNMRDNGSTALYIAAQNNHIEVIKILLNNGARMDILFKDKISPLGAAAGRGYLDIVKLFCDLGYLNSLSDPFYLACQFGQLEVVKYLITQGVDINQKFENKTPLAAAQNNFQHDITKFLIQNGAI